MRLVAIWWTENRRSVAVVIAALLIAAILIAAIGNLQDSQTI